ncbi:MFS transporter [Nocardia sp. NPDC051832]|uniref:MFS transporter n=1 Tax=Nocardia sp. NPDC051832 TaxID=3155673 RepID=UPI0034380028
MLSHDHAPTTVLIGGVMLLDGVSTWVTTSLLPTAVDDIGGRQLYAWATTVFLLTSVIAALLVARTVSGVGARTGFEIGLGAFIVGTLTAAAAPAMPVLLAGRGIQGAGVGLVAGLSYVSVQAELPQRLWSRASGLISAAMAAGFFIGPLIGGICAQLGLWRLAFLVVAALTAPLMLLVPRAIRRHQRDRRLDPIPVGSVLLLTGSAALIGVAGLRTDPAFTTIAVASGLTLIAIFLLRESRPRQRARVLPLLTYTSGAPLARLYLTRALITIAASAEAFITLFGQELGNLTPVAAGFLGTALPVGWALTQLASSTIDSATLIRRLSVIGPLLTAAALAFTATLHHTQPSGLTITGWALGYLLAGSGIGMAMPHLTVAVMAAATTPGEATKASAAMNTVGLFAFSIGSALGGTILGLAHPSLPRAGHYLLLACATSATLAALIATSTLRSTTTGPEQRSI